MSQTFTIDKKLNVEASFDKYNNEINTLMNLNNGLINLYTLVKVEEIRIIKSNPNVEIAFAFGNSPEFNPQFMSLLPCLFHWFGSSICNYARLAGYIVAREQGEINDEDIELEPNRERIKKACNNYVNSVGELEKIKKWRNKVSAHFALTDPLSSDNLATMEASIIYPVGFSVDRFKTSVFNLTRGDDTKSFTSEIPQWSLTRTYENLIERYWPYIDLSNFGVKSEG